MMEDATMSETTFQKIKNRDLEWNEKTLVVDCKDLTLEDWRHFCHALKGNRTVTNLQICGYMSSSFTLSFNEVLKENTCLKHLHVDDISDLEAFCKGLPASKTLTDLHIGNSFTLLTEEDFNLFFDAVKHLEGLHLFTDFEQEFAEGTYQLLEANRNLKCLNIKSFKLGNRERLWKALKVNTTLKTLELHYCIFSEGDYVNLFNALATNSSLTCLIVAPNFRNNGSAPLLALANLLNVNTTLKQLCCLFRHHQSATPALVDALKRTTLQALNIDLNYESIVEVLKFNKSLRFCNIATREVSDGKLLCEALKQNETLQAITVEPTEDSHEKFMESMLDLLRTNKTLLRINCSSVPVEVLAALKENLLLQARICDNTFKIMWLIASSKHSLLPEELWIHIFKYIRLPDRDYNNNNLDNMLKYLFLLRHLLADPICYNLSKTTQNEMLYTLIDFMLELYCSKLDDPERDPIIIEARSTISSFLCQNKLTEVTEVFTQVITKRRNTRLYNCLTVVS